MADNTVKGLYLSLGLDISELEAGFALADRTVNQAILRFKSEAAQVKLKADIDTLQAEDALEKLKAQYKGLGEQIEIARKQELLLQRDLQASKTSLGADNPLTRKAETTLLKQQRATAQLVARQRELGATIQAASSPWFKFAEALNAARGGASGVASALGAAAGPLAAVTAVVGAGIGLASLTKDAADAAAAIGDLGDQLGIGTEAAAQLKGTLGAAGVDTDGFVSWITRLDKSVMSAGASGNEMTRTLARFGVSLTDDTGKLVDYNEQLRRLAEAYQNAKAAGNVNEFLAGLGRGAAQYRDLFNKLESDYKPLGLEMYSEPLKRSAADAMKLTDQMNKLDKQLDAVKLAFGAAFVPAATEILPSVIAAVQELSGAIGPLLSSLGQRLKRVGRNPVDDGAQTAAKRRETDARAAEQAKREAEVAAEAEKKAAQENAAAIEDIWRKATASKLENDLAAIDARMKKELEAADLTEAARARIEERYNAERQATLYKANQEMERMNRDLSDSIAKQTQGELENALRGIDRQAEATREKYKTLFGTLSEETNALIQQNANLQRQQAIQSRADKALTSEKKYWNIFQDAMNGGMLTERHRSGLKMYTLTENLSQEERLKVAEDAMRKAMLKERGISNADVKTSDLMAFDEIMKRLQGGGLANIQDDAGIMGEKVSAAVSQSLEGASAQMAEGMNTRLAPALESLSNGSANYQSAALNEYQEIKAAISDLAAKMDEREAVAPQITVTIESAVTEDSASMTHLADTVADRISEVITQYVGTGANTY